MTRPCLLVDVDFTLNPDLGATWDTAEGNSLRDAGWVILQGFSMNARPVWLNIWHGRDLLRAAYETGAELMWATRWHDMANRVISPLLGLPQLAVAPCDPCRDKPATVIPWLEGRPFAWLDDEESVIAGCGGHGVKVDPATGLTAADIEQAARMLGKGALAPVG